MTIPTNITTELANLQKQLTAASPLSSATGPTIVALQLNCGQLVSDIETALDNAAGNLDGWIPPTDPQAIISGFLGIVGNADDQQTLATMGGYVGRSNLNLDQLV